MHKKAVWMISIVAAVSLLVFLSLAVTGKFRAMAQKEEDGAVRMLAVNVGKADGILLWVDGKTFLVDTGTVQSWGALQAALYANGVTHLDGVFLTHTDKDHMGGMASLAQSNIEVDAWYASAMYTGVKQEKHPALLAAAKRGKQAVWLKAGDTVAVSDTARFIVLGPISLDSASENNNSLVMRLTTAQGDVLLAGDMEFKEEKALMDAGSITPCAVLKVSHHGEDDSTSSSFVNLVSPQVAVISTNSQEEPDTPHPVVLTALKKAGATIAVTQNAAGGVLVTLKDGQAQAEFARWEQIPAVNQAVQLTSMDTGNDTIQLQNLSDETVSLAGWYVFSTKGEEIFRFPEYATLPPHQGKTIGAGDTEGIYDWRFDEKNVWHNKKIDEAVLYDPYGRIASRLGNGLAGE